MFTIMRIRYGEASMSNALRWAGRAFMWICTALVVLSGLVYVVGKAVGIPVRVTYQTVERVDLPGRQRAASALPGSAAGGDSTRVPGDSASVDGSPTTAATAQNVILFIGDGMGLSMLSTVDALAEQRLFMSRLPVTGLVRMASLDNIITDSAAGATAFSTGYRTNNGAVAMTPGAPEFVRRQTILEAAATQGVATGVVTTSYLTDATPAAFVAHARDRDLYDPIARQMVDSRADVLVGGAQPEVFTDSLLHVARARGFAISDALDGLTGADSSARWIGLFPEREGRFDKMHGPPLAQTTEAAIRKLRGRGERFFLVVEQEGTDAAGHINRLGDARRYLHELDRAVERAVSLAGPQTLILVTADHDTGGLSITDTRRDESEGDDNRIAEALNREGEVTARWNVFGHTADWTPLLAYGPGAQRFTGVFRNTALPRRLARLLEVGDFWEEAERSPGPAATR